jgi:hypothetical protein
MVFEEKKNFFFVFLQKKFYKSENMIILKEITTTADATNRYTRFYNSVD